jgi:subtilisin family serine protease
MDKLTTGPHNGLDSNGGSNSISVAGKERFVRFGLGRARAATAVAVVLIQLMSIGLLPRIQETQAQENQTLQVAPGRYIVRLKTGSGFSSAASVASTYDTKPGVDVDQVYTTVFNGFAGQFSDAAARDLLKDPNVDGVYPDGISHLQAQYDLPGIDRVDADLNPTKAGNGSDSVGVDVAVIDTGVTMHPDLNVYRGVDCTVGPGRSNAFTDYLGHGTHVAGTIGAYDNGFGVVGVAPGARIWAIKVFSDGQNPETAGAYDSEILCGLDYVRKNAASIEVVNMSLGGYRGIESSSCAANPYHQAYCNVVNAGVTVVVAAGNAYDDARYYVPAQYDQVITVSAYHDSDGQPGGLGPYSPTTGDADDSFASFSNWGSDVDIAAPGVDILSTASPNAPYTGAYCPEFDYCYLSGTSMAAPAVAGGAALILAQQGKMSPASVQARLRLTGQPFDLPGDLDGIHEPLMNVGFLGKGKITAPSSVKVGDSIQVRVGDYTPATRAIFRFNGTYIGGDTIDDAGRGHRNYTIPNMPAGTYSATVTNGLKTLSRNVKVVSSVSVNRSSAPIGETITVTLRGFGNGETVTVKHGSRVVGTKTVSSSGYGTLSFVVPASTGGYYAVTGTGSVGNSASVNLKVIGSAYLRTGTPAPGATVYISYRGFKAGESVQYLYDTQSGPVINTTPEIASSTGSGDDSVRIPSDSSIDSHYVWLIGDQGTKVRIALSIGAAQAPEPTATATAEPTQPASPEPTIEAPASPEPTLETPTETPIPEPTVEPPTETPVTEAPTATPAVSEGSPAAGE